MWAVISRALRFSREIQLSVFKPSQHSPPAVLLFPCSDLVSILEDSLLLVSYPGWQQSGFVQNQNQFPLQTLGCNPQEIGKISAFAGTGKDYPKRKKPLFLGRRLICWEKSEDGVKQ